MMTTCLICPGGGVVEWVELQPLRLSNRELAASTKRDRHRNAVRRIGDGLLGSVQRYGSITLAERFPLGGAQIIGSAAAILRRQRRCQQRLYDRRAVRRRTSAAKAGSLREARLISTLARAPVTAAPARAVAVVKSDFMLGLVMGSRDFAICAIS